MKQPVGIKLGLVCGIFVVVIAGCREHAATNASTRNPGGFFKNIAGTAGVKFKHDNGARGEFRFIESTGSGCAFVDYDNDGFLDIFLVQSGPIPGTKERAEYNAKSESGNRLFHNNRNGTFTDRTSGSGLEKCGYGQGVTIGDYDEDGFDDIFVTAYGGNHLYRNDLGTGKFTDVSMAAGVADTDQGQRYSTSAAFGDYDNDGLLDLYVCHYMPWSVAKDRRCHDARKRPDYCSPDVYDPDVHRLYRNQGDGTFADASAIAGITKKRGRGLAVAFWDGDQDGDEDIFVANDLTPQFLWRNNGNGTFSEIAEEAGCAYEDKGDVAAGMGIGIGDWDNDGKEDLFLTNFSGQPNCLWRNSGNMIFEDVSYMSGVAQAHLKFLSFGCEFLDFDSDGYKDLIVANGHVQFHADVTYEGTTYRERLQLLQNDRGKKFREIVRELGDMQRERVSRGLAVGDIENDGRLDVLINNQNDPADLFRNEMQTSNHWISFILTGTKSNRDGYHAKVKVFCSGSGADKTSPPPVMYAQARAGSSYASASDRRVYFGLGNAERADKVEIVWPSRMRDVLKDLPSNRIYAVIEGKGVLQEK